MSEATKYELVREKYSQDEVSSTHGSEEGLLSGLPRDVSSPLTHNILAKRWKLLVAHACLLLLNALFAAVTVLKFGTSGSNADCYTEPNLVYSPAQDAVEYEARTFNTSLFVKNKFNGQPSEEQKNAWGNFSRYENIILSSEELRKLNRTSIEIKGQGYLASLGVTHQLHCLNYIRKYIYSDYYGINEDPQTVRVHISHCIDDLRQTIQCHGDTSILTYSWRPDYGRPWPDFQIQHQCRNFNKLIEWTESRRAQINAENFIHPTLGSVLTAVNNSTVPTAFEGATELVGGTRMWDLKIDDPW